jgi:hypothetical protein
VVVSGTGPMTIANDNAYFPVSAGGGVMLDKRPVCEKCGNVKWLKTCSVCEGECEDVGRPPEKCFDCGESIVASDDDAHVCINCGGRNRRA